ncbi:MAG: glycosyltransferase [bacterium]|nr:glycosyltransferase [bacterium]
MQPWRFYGQLPEREDCAEEMYKVIILITSWNHLNYTLSCLESLKRCTPGTESYKYDFVIIDDCSTDDGLADALAAVDGVRFIRLTENRGITYCWNWGFREYRNSHDIIIFCNNDVIFSPGWAEKLCDCLMSKKLDFVGPLTNTPGFIDKQDIRKYCKNYIHSNKIKEVNDTASRITDGSWRRINKINGFCMCVRMEFLRRNVLPDGNVFEPANIIFKSDDEIQSRTKPRAGICLSSFVFHYKQISVGHLKDRPRIKRVYRREMNNDRIGRQRVLSKIIDAVKTKKSKARAMGLMAAVLAVICTLAYILTAPLPPHSHIHNRQPEKEEAGRQELPGDIKSVTIREGRLIGQEAGRNIWELDAQKIQATDKRVVMDKAGAVLFRPQLPDLVLTAPRITYLPQQDTWSATGGVKGSAGPDLELRIGRMNYEGKQRAIRGEEGVVLSGRCWRLEGGRLDADAQLKRIAVSDRARLEYFD